MEYLGITSFWPIFEARIPVRKKYERCLFDRSVRCCTCSACLVTFQICFGQRRIWFLRLASYRISDTNCYVKKPPPRDTQKKTTSSTAHTFDSRTFHLLHLNTFAWAVVNADPVRLAKWHTMRNVTFPLYRAKDKDLPVIAAEYQRYFAINRPIGDISLWHKPVHYVSFKYIGQQTTTHSISSLYVISHV